MPRGGPLAGKDAGPFAGILRVMVPYAIRLLTGLLLSSAAFAVFLPAQEPAPCDAALLTAKEPQPVFVRMRNQLFARGGDYEAFCREHATTPRSGLRAENVADLRTRADDSWRACRDLVDELVTAGELRDVRRFWIVNGFAADASAAAVERLRRLPETAYVHLQTQPGRSQQQRQPRPERWLAARAADERQALVMLERRGEEAAFDPAGLTVPWNLQAIRADAAWKLGACGQGVVVALLDSGVLMTEPLVHALWRNPGEQANGRDDDGNGFVDDLFGWDFDGDDRFVVGDGAKSHGTMCGGIIAGRPWGEPRTVTGVAPRSRLMVLRGMGSLRAYEYAAAMGADVLSMSYMWIGVELGSYRGVFRTAHEHLAACGVVAVGGAGNFGRSAPEGKQIALPKDIPCVIAASGIGADGAAPDFSSRGPCTWDDVPFFGDHPASAPLRKPDLAGCAAGFPLWHRTAMAGRKVEIVWQDDAGYGLIVGPRGNSFSGPHAAGAAALMLSVQPELTPWRVKELLESTCLDRGEEGWDATYGAGLIQADAAVRAAKAATVRD
ncbi:MAG: S8 family serine peptidase [Planctomycetes bacterium]|nr:S8 family serine peptidase [Planctomycetota bacterium]